MEYAAFHVENLEPALVHFRGGGIAAAAAAAIEVVCALFVKRADAFGKGFAVQKIQVDGSFQVAVGIFRWLTNVEYDCRRVCFAAAINSSGPSILTGDWAVQLLKNPMAIRMESIIFS